MFNHRRKTIGKSMYYVSENGGSYQIKEIYDGNIVGRSDYLHHRIDDALHELENIRCEKYYTDSTRLLRF